MKGEYAATSLQLRGVWTVKLQQVMNTLPGYIIISFLNLKCSVSGLIFCLQLSHRNSVIQKLRAQNNDMADKV